MAEKEVNLGGDDAAGKKGGKARLIILLLVAVILVAGGGAAAWFLLMGDETDTEQAEPGPPQRLYLSLEPMTVNIEAPGRIRYLRTELSLVTHDPAVSAAIERYMPAIRNDMLGVLGEQRYEDLNTRAGKEALAEELRDTVRGILASRNAPQAVEAVLFNELVMQ
ncbi:flagellar basal body-associated protein FliL [Thioalkalivibrio sp. ALJT]|uniref:flagellar basal body-associated FliL family protein n=1 Tax=Thioalkalivibrio sp. ALJT TaxID=1158146 RepID=UPI0003626B2A|nr:flagellar basal body-associated FliL family protein [Thioalkalivibrio sp. ALJT]